MDETVGRALRRALAEAGRSQYWLAGRARESAVTVCRITRETRRPTESQLLRLSCGLLCGGPDYAAYLDIVYAGAATGSAIARLLQARDLGAIDVARRSHVGLMSVERFLRGDAPLPDAKVMRIFAAAVLSGERLALVNQLLDLAGYLTIGDTADDGRASA